MAQSSPTVDLTILSVSGDGSCINVGGLALNCTLPFLLNFTVVHLPTPVPDYALAIVFDNTTWLSTKLLTATFGGTFISTTVSSQQFAVSGLTVFSASLQWKPLINGSRVVQQWGPHTGVQHPAVELSHCHVRLRM